MEGGVYCLLLLSLREADLRVGALGEIQIGEGYYCYVGSALGGVLPRVRRHLTRPARVRWHIDYLTSSPWIAPMTAVYGLTRERLEDRLYDMVPGEEVPGFGASDSPKRSHLKYLGRDLAGSRAAAEAAVSGVGLRPRYLEAAEAVLLDLDGTLVNYPDVREAAVAALARSMGRDPGRFSHEYEGVRAEIYRTRSGPDKFSKALVFEEMGFTRKEALELEERYWEIASSMIRAYPDARVLDPLRGRGFGLYLFSDGRRCAQLGKMEAAGIDPEEFDGVIFSEDIGKNKDEEGAYREALGVANLAPHAVIMVGDSLSQDIFPALASGVRAILLDRRSRAERPPGVPRIRSLWELADLLVRPQPRPYGGGERGI